MHVASHEVTWCMVVCCTQNLCRDGSSFMWHQPCQRLSTSSLQWILKKRAVKKDSESAWESGEWSLLYKRSSINNLDLLPIGAAWTWGARIAGLAAWVAGDQWQHSEPSQWLLGQQDGGTQWKWANTFNVSVVCELQTTFSHPWFHHPHFWLWHRSTFSHLCSICQCRFRASGRSISGGGTVRNGDYKKTKLSTLRQIIKTFKMI